MAKKTKASTADKAAAPLPGADAPDSGVPLHSFETTRGPVESKATTVKDALGLAAGDAGEKPKGRRPKGPVVIKSRSPRYTAAGANFNSGGTVYRPQDFTDEQWAIVGDNPNLVVTKASGSDADY